MAYGKESKRNRGYRKEDWGGRSREDRRDRRRSPSLERERHEYDDRSPRHDAIRRSKGRFTPSTSPPRRRSSFRSRSPSWSRDYRYERSHDRRESLSPRREYENDSPVRRRQRYYRRRSISRESSYSKADYRYRGDRDRSYASNRSRDASYPRSRRGSYEEDMYRESRDERVGSWSRQRREVSSSRYDRAGERKFPRGDESLERPPSPEGGSRRRSIDRGEHGGDRQRRYSNYLEDEELRIREQQRNGGRHERQESDSRDDFRHGYAGKRGERWKHDREEGKKERRNSEHTRTKEQDAFRGGKREQEGVQSMTTSEAPARREKDEQHSAGGITADASEKAVAAAHIRQDEQETNVENKLQITVDTEETRKASSDANGSRRRGVELGLRIAARSSVSISKKMKIAWKTGANSPSNERSPPSTEPTEEEIAKKRQEMRDKWDNIQKASREARRSVTKWGLTEAEVEHVVAETENLPSRSLLASRIPHLKKLILGS